MILTVFVAVRGGIVQFLHPPFSLTSLYVVSFIKKEKRRLFLARAEIKPERDWTIPRP